MVDHVKALGYKITLPKAIAFFFSALILFWVMDIEIFNVLRGADFESLFIGAWIAGIGFALFVEALASAPDAKKGTSKAGALVLGGVGAISFAFGVLSIAGGIDIITGTPELRTITTVLLFGGVLLWFGTLIPETVFRTTFIKKLNM